MGILDFLFPSETKRIEKLKKKGKVYDILAYLDKKDEELKQKAISTLLDMLKEGKMSKNEEETVIEKLDPIIRIKDKNRVDKINDPYELRRIAINEYLAKKDLDMAIYTLKRALSLKEGEVSFMNNLAAAYSMKGEFEEAQNIWEEILKKDPNNTAAVENYCTALHLKARKILDQKKDSQEARDLLLRAIEINPTHINSLYEIAEYHSNNKNFEKAIYYYRKCLSNARIPSGYTDIYEFRGWINRKIADQYRALGEKKEAIDFYNQALSSYRWDEPEVIKIQEAIKSLK